MSVDDTSAPPKAVNIERKSMLIAGEWVGSSNGATISVENPATEAIIAEVPEADDRDIDAAVRAARTAFQSPTWRDIPPLAREAMLHRIADGIEARAEEFARLESLDNGKPINDARTIDVPFAAAMFRYMAGFPTRITGRAFDISAPGGPYHTYTLKQPVGVVGQIIPWNFPLIMAAMKLAPALAAGCTVVLKPAEQTPLTALLLGEVILEAGLPPGVVNIITGYGETAGARLVAHPGVDKIAFTGSTTVGKSIAKTCTEQMKRVSLELGGKSPMIVLDDAALEVATPGVAQAIFWNSGQVCFAGSRLYAEHKIYDRLVEGLADVANSLKIGPGSEETTQIGPLISSQQRAQVEAKIAKGVSEGAEIVAGGNRVMDQGYFLQPTIMSATHSQMEIVREEVFGPVLAVSPAKNIDDIVREANDTRYGLAASIWTTNLSSAHNLARRINAGTVWINTHVATDPAMPFGGFKESGLGRENGPDGLDLYLETKTVCANLV